MRVAKLFGQFYASLFEQKILIFRLVTFLFTYQDSITQNWHLKIILYLFVVAIYPKVSAVHHNDVHRPKSFLNSRFSNISELINQNYMVHTAFVTTGFVVIAISFIASALGHHYCFKALGLGAAANIQRTMSSNTANANLAGFIPDGNFCSFSWCNHQKISCPAYLAG